MGDKDMAETKRIVRLKGETLRLSGPELEIGQKAARTISRACKRYPITSTRLLAALTACLLRNFVCSAGPFSSLTEMTSCDMWNMFQR